MVAPSNRAHSRNEANPIGGKDENEDSSKKPERPINEVLTKDSLEKVVDALDNPFEDARITSIDAELDVRFGRDVVNIVDARVASDVVDPGKPVHVYVTLKRYDDDSERVEIVTVPIPKSAAGDNVEITVEPGDQVRIDQPKPNSLDDLFRSVRVGYPSTSLVVSTKLPQQGVKLRGQLVDSLPGSALDTLQPANESDRPAMFSTFERQERPGRDVLQGSAKIKLNVREEPLR